MLDATCEDQGRDTDEAQLVPQAANRVLGAPGWLLGPSQVTSTAALLSLSGGVCS